MVAIVNLEQMCTKICGRRTCTCSRGGWKQQKLRAGRDLYRTGPDVALWMCSVLGAGCFPSDPSGLFPLPQAHRCALPWCGTSHVYQMSLGLTGMCCEVRSPSGFRCVLGRCISIVPCAYGCKSCWKSYGLDQRGKFVAVRISWEVCFGFWLQGAWVLCVSAKGSPNRSGMQILKCFGGRREQSLPNLNLGCCSPLMGALWLCLTVEGKGGISERRYSFWSWHHFSWPWSGSS